jgi:pyruvate dehydrogenase E2 component (dihydrolipoamide acetyltransferase)
MPTDIIMPKLGLTMEEGTLVRWRAAEGDRVTAGQPLMEVETDKVTIEVEAPVTGIVAAPLVGEGQQVPVGALLGQIMAEGEILRLAQDDRANTAEPASRITPLARRMAEQAGLDLAAVTPNTPGGRITAQHARTIAIQNPPPSTGRIFSSPRARRRARERGVEWRTLPGSGPRGRVIERDVLRAAATPPTVSPVPVTASASLPTGAEVRWETPTVAQRTAAERMTASFGSAPHFYLDVEVQAEALLALRERLLPAVERKAGVRLTVTDLLARIAGAALAEHPRANAFWADGRIGLHERVNVGIAVADGDPARPDGSAGLVVPVLRDVNRKPLSQVAAERAALVVRARAGRLTPDDLAGGTFTLTNLGMYRVDSFHAILNPPQAAIMAVGRIAERPVAASGQIVARQTVMLALACDHRVLDGVLAAHFLGRVAELIENPYELLA